MKDTFNSDMGSPGKSCGIQTEEQRHQKFLNLVLKSTLREAVQFVFEREKGEVLQTNNLDEDRMGTINKTVTLVFEVKHSHEQIPSCAELETYKEMPILFLSTSWRRQSNRLREKFRVVMAREVRTQNHYRDGF